MFFKTTPDLLKKRDYVFFKMFIMSLCFYVIMNTLWTLQEYDRINLPKVLFIIVCFFSYSSIIFTLIVFILSQCLIMNIKQKMDMLWRY